MTATPPGWYDDGQGELRWWDGDAWTEHVHELLPVPEKASARPVSPARRSVPDLEIDLRTPKPPVTLPERLVAFVASGTSLPPRSMTEAEARAFLAPLLEQDDDYVADGDAVLIQPGMRQGENDGRIFLTRKWFLFWFDGSRSPYLIAPLSSPPARSGWTDGPPTRRDSGASRSW